MIGDNVAELFVNDYQPYIYIKGGYPHRMGFGVFIGNKMLKKEDGIFSLTEDIQAATFLDSKDKVLTLIGEYCNQDDFKEKFVFLFSEKNIGYKQNLEILSELLNKYKNHNVSEDIRAKFHKYLQEKNMKPRTRESMMYQIPVLSVKVMDDHGGDIHQIPSSFFGSDDFKYTFSAYKTGPIGREGIFIDIMLRDPSVDSIFAKEEDFDTVFNDLLSLIKELKRIEP